MSSFALTPVSPPERHYWIGGRRENRQLPADATGRLVYVSWIVPGSLTTGAYVIEGTREMLWLLIDHPDALIEYCRTPEPRDGEPPADREPPPPPPPPPPIKRRQNLSAEELAARFVELRPIVVEGLPDAHKVWINVEGDVYPLNSYSDSLADAERLGACLGRALLRIVELARSDC